MYGLVRMHREAVMAIAAVRHEALQCKAPDEGQGGGSGINISEAESWTGAAPRVRARLAIEGAGQASDVDNIRQ